MLKRYSEFHDLKAALVRARAPGASNLPLPEKRFRMRGKGDNQKTLHERKDGLVMFMTVLLQMGRSEEDIDLDTAWAEMDEDGSGEVEYDEFKPWFFAQHGLNAAGAMDLDQAWLELDEDGSGEVDFEEFKPWYFRQHDNLAHAAELKVGNP